MNFRGLWILASLRGSLGGLAYLEMFVIEQALWRNWQSVIFIENKFEVEFFRNLSSRFIPVAVLNQLPKNDCRNGVVIFWPAANLTNNGCSYLILAEKQHTDSLFAHLNQSPLTIAADMIIAFHASTDDQAETLILKQVYKKGPLAEVTVLNLGIWETGEPPALNPEPPETRTADHNVFIKVGVKNTSILDDHGHWNFASFVEKDEEVTMLTLLRSLFSAMNISYELLVFSKLGWKSEETGWTHLLGAIADGSVDVAADTLDQSIYDGSNALRLSDPIVKTMSCVYFRKSGSGRSQDVVRATFSNELQISVLVTGLLLWMAMLGITVATARFTVDDKEVWEPTEALLWAVSVLTMQGSPWAPKSLSGCILLIFSLMFALITYNSYAAFITSVLSVQTSPFRSIDEIIKTDYRFGFTKQSSEEFFLRTTEDPALRAFYLRSLITGDAVGDVVGGIQRSVEEHYGFFAMARLARRVIQLKLSSQYRCRLHELCVKSTITSAGIPISATSPYNVLIHYWLIRFRETGILARIQSRLLPPMPTCSRGQQFHGASFSDLLSAYFLFTLGVAASVVIFIAELIWAKRKRFICKNQPRGLPVRPQRFQKSDYDYFY